MQNDLLACCDEYAASVALIEADREYTYAELAARVRELEAVLRAHEIGAHECVVLQGQFSFETVAWLLALYGNRNIIAPVSQPTELARESLRDSCAPSHWLDVRAGWSIERCTLPAETLPAETLPAETAAAAAVPASEAGAAPALLGRLRASGAAGLVLLSSGSSGRPKVILHDLSRIVAGKLQARRRRRLSIILFLLFDHIGGINTLLGTLVSGNTAIAIQDHTPDEVCRLVQRHRARVLPTSPTFLNLLLVGGYLERYDLSSLKLITYGTEPMPDTLLERVHVGFPGARLLQTFGTSETGISGTQSASSRSTYFKLEDHLFEQRVIEGELQLRSRTQFLGYLSQRTENVTEDGWFKTGDLVEAGADGYFRIKGRVSDTINVGGEKVLPTEVESVLLGSPLVAECVVYGEPNAITGQHVCAEVQPAREMPAAELRAHVQQFLAARLEAFKVPVRIKAVGEIRRSERFKKLRRQA
jgi:acyl-coenzyme A synthetase/AMP-(fatty) acid ligase